MNWLRGCLPAVGIEPVTCGLEVESTTKYTSRTKILLRKWTSNATKILAKKKQIQAMCKIWCKTWNLQLTIDSSTIKAWRTGWSKKKNRLRQWIRWLVIFLKWIPMVGMWIIALWWLHSMIPMSEVECTSNRFNRVEARKLLLSRNRSENLRWSDRMSVTNNILSR